MGQRIAMMVWKEFIQIRRDPRMLTVVVILPMVMLLLYGYAINLDVRHVRLAVYDLDRSQSSRALVDAFSHSGYFDVRHDISNRHDVDYQLDSGNAQLVLVIPPTYSDDLASGHHAVVQLLLDGSDSTVASTVVGYAGLIVQQHSLRTALSVVPAAVRTAVQPVDLRTRYWYNPELRSTLFIIPGLIAVVLMMLSALLTSVTIVRERERGTIEQLIVSPVKPLEIMLGKLIPYVTIAFGDILLVMLVSAFVFHVPLKGNPVLALVLSGVFVTAALGIGLFISTIANSQQIALTAAMLTTQLPSVLLSGFMFPISNMPRAIQLFTNIIPATHFIRIMRGIYMKESTLVQLWKPALFLLAIGIGMLLLSAKRFKKQL